MMAGASSESTGAVVFGGGLGGAIATILAWAARAFLGYELPPEVASAMATLLIALGGWIGSLTRKGV